MIKLFISQPMDKLSAQEILLQRQKAIEYVRNVYDDNIEVIDSYIHIPNGKPLEYIAESIRLLSQADIVYFVKGWNKSRGCRIEYMCANLYGVDIVV